MFEVKVKGNTTTYPQKSIELQINYRTVTVDDEKTLITIMEKYEPEQLYIKVKNVFLPLYNCYYKALQDVYLCEGVEYEL